MNKKAVISTGSDFSHVDKKIEAVVSGYKASGWRMLDTRYRKVEFFKENARSNTGPVPVMLIEVKKMTWKLDRHGLS